MSKPGSLFRLSLLSNQYPVLHGLRVLAIISVVQVHLSTEAALRGYLPNTHLLYQISQRIWFGMDLFFILSGFLIGNILLIGAERGGASVLKFYGRRSFRIIPLYYVVLTALALIGPLDDPLKRAQLWREYAYLTNYSDTGHVVMFWGWSLCVEEHFYILVPFLVKALTALKTHAQRLGMLMALWVGCVVIRFAIAYSGTLGHDTASYFHGLYIPTHTRFDTLVAGIAMAYVLRTWEPQLRAALARPAVRNASLALTVLSFGALLMPLSKGPVWTLLATGTVTSIAWINLLLYLMLSPPSAAGRALGSRKFLYVATLGYGVYLIHMPLVLAVGVPMFVRAHRSGMNVLASFVLGVGGAFGASLMLAYVLHLLIEKPALLARDKLVPA